jgi:hypothetical protein
LLICIAFTSCNSLDSGEPTGQNDDTFAENFGTAVNRDFIGQVVDTDNHPIQGVTISIGSATAQTDVNGVFIINNAGVYQKFAYIKAKKTGYIDGSRTMVPTSGKNNVKIMLLPNTPVATIQSGQVSEVTLPSGTKVTFDGVFQDENGSDYSGAVQVAMYHLLPSNNNLEMIMPGMLYAQRIDNQQVVLNTFGMMNVELKGSAGQKVYLRYGHPAQISQLIDDSQLGSAPSTIPLWHFDEAKGYWKEEGFATRVGNKYVGSVSHFSWWNCDIPNSSLLLTFTFQDSNGNPLSNLHINILNPAGYHASGSTDANGQLAGILPANQELTVNVYAGYSCGVAFSTTVGPFTVDTVVPVITVGSTSVLSSEVVGTLLKCNGSNVTNGYVYLSRNGGFSVTPVTNGAFSFNEMYCSSNTAFTLKGVDYETLQTTDSISYNFTPPITNIGNIQACNAVTEFISYQIDNGETVILFDQINAGSGTSAGLNINAYSQNTPNGNGIYIFGTTNIPGTYTTSTFSIEGTGVGYISASSTNTIQFILNNFGAVGEFIDMTFSGTYDDTTGTHTLTGVAHVIRDN